MAGEERGTSQEPPEIHLSLGITAGRLDCVAIRSRIACYGDDKQIGGQEHLLCHGLVRMGREPKQKRDGTV